MTSSNLPARFNLTVVLSGSRCLGLYIFAFVFVIRLFALLRLTSSPLLFPAGGDMHFYDDWARRIVNGQFSDHFAFYGLPLYAYLLALLYRLFGDSPFIPGFLQACLDAGTATLLFKIAGGVFRRDGEPSSSYGSLIGLIAAIAWAFFVPAQAYSVILMPTTWFVFVFWYFMWQIVKTEDAPTLLNALAFGILIGITAMGIATILFLIPLMLAALLFKPQSNKMRLRSPWVARSLTVVLLLLGVAVGTAPCWVYNRAVAHDSVFLSAHSGINLWLGNNPDATGYPHFPGLRAGQAAMLKDSIDIAEAAAGKNLKRSEVSHYWSAKARTYIAQNLSGWLGLMGQKVVKFWSAFYYDDLNIIDKLRMSGVIFPGLHFGIVAAFAFPGVCFSIRRFPGTRWITAAILVQSLAVLSVFVTERYRLAVVPGLILFAVAGGWMFWENCLFMRGKQAVVYLGALVAALLFVTWPQRDPAPWALKFYNSGLHALDLQDWATAKEKLELAHAYVPESTEVNLALGNLWLQQQDLPLAENYYLAVLQMDARHKSALNNLGVVAISKKDWGNADKYLRAAVDIDPNDSKTHYLLARAQFEAGHVSDALSEIQIALRLRPEQREYQELYELVQKQQQ